jgi:hypothetical protein
LESSNFVDVAAPGGWARDPGGPRSVAAVMGATARDQACPAGGIEDYTDDGREASWHAGCSGTPADNGFFGEGVVDAAAAVGG